MTSNKHRKRLARRRAAKTGESYVTALRHVRASAKENNDMSTTDQTARAHGDLVHCSFCGKSQKQVKKLIAGPGVYICDECIGLCVGIIEGETGTPVEPRGLGDLPRVTPTADVLLARLEGLQRTASATSQQLAAGVRRSRDAGASWAEIAGALDITEAEAVRQFDGDTND